MGLDQHCGNDCDDGESCCDGRNEVVEFDVSHVLYIESYLASVTTYAGLLGSHPESYGWPTWLLREWCSLAGFV